MDEHRLASMQPKNDLWADYANDLAQGRMQAAENFAREVGGWLRGMMAKWLPDEEDHEQAALDVLAEVVASIDRFQPARGSLRGWVRCVALRRTADYYRLRERQRHGKPGEARQANARHLTERPSASLKARLLASVASLDMADVELLRLFLEEKMTDSEVARLLAITADNARQRKRRLLSRLQRVIHHAPDAEHS